MSLALSLCQYVLRPRRGLGQVSPSLEAPRLQLWIYHRFHQRNRKGKIVMIKTSKCMGLALGSFLAPETEMIFGDGVGGLPYFSTLRSPKSLKNTLSCLSSNLSLLSASSLLCFSSVHIVGSLTSKPSTICKSAHHCMQFCLTR